MSLNSSCPSAVLCPTDMTPRPSVPTLGQETETLDTETQGNYKRESLHYDRANGILPLEWPNLATFETWRQNEVWASSGPRNGNACLKNMGWWNRQLASPVGTTAPTTIPKVRGNIQEHGLNPTRYPIPPLQSCPLRAYFCNLNKMHGPLTTFPQSFFVFMLLSVV